MQGAEAGQASTQLAGPGLVVVGQDEGRGVVEEQLCLAARQHHHVAPGAVPPLVAPPQRHVQLCPAAHQRGLTQTTLRALLVYSFAENHEPGEKHGPTSAGAHANNVTCTAGIQFLRKS